MNTQPSPTALASIGAASIQDLIARSADIKAELVAFAQRPRFADELNEQLIDGADEHGELDEASAVLILDRFALQHRLSGGRTVVETFVAQRRPRLTATEREMTLGWRDVIEACFEVRRLDGDAVELHNLLDDVVYRVYSNMGPAVFAQLRPNMFAIGRIVPVHPDIDAWLISGHFTTGATSSRGDIARAAVNQVLAHPELLHRNPVLYARAWEIQAEHRADFIAQVGSDLVVLPPEQAQETLRAHYRRQLPTASMEDRSKLTGVAPSGLAPAQMARLPDELLDAESVGIIFDELDGLSYYRDFGRLAALFADPRLASDPAHLSVLRTYLHDASVSPVPIRRLVQRHPEGTDQVFRALLNKPGFVWNRDGEKLLRRHKKKFLDREPVPSVSVIGNRLSELLA